MKWGFVREKRRNNGRMWYYYNGQKRWVSRSQYGEKLYAKEQCEGLANEITREIKNGTHELSIYGKPKGLEPENAWDTYQDNATAGPRRMEGREIAFRKYILPYFEENNIRSIREFKDLDAANWVVWLKGKGLESSSMNVIKTIFVGFLKFHQRSLVYVPKFPTIRVEKKEKLWLNEAQQEKVISMIATHHHPVFRFLQVSGCRVDEACKLRWTDLDWDIKPEQKAVGIVGIVTLRDRKAKDLNQLPIKQGLASTIRSQSVRNFEYVFCGKKGQKYTRNNLYNLWIKAIKEAHKQDPTIKIMPLMNGTRHSKAWMMLNDGYSPHQVARQLGNSVEMVMQHYGGITVEKVAEWTEKEAQNGH